MDSADALPPSGAHAELSRIIFGSNFMLSSGASSDDDNWIKTVVSGNSSSGDDSWIKIEKSVTWNAAEAVVRRAASMPCFGRRRRLATERLAIEQRAGLAIEQRLRR